jgi:hypothetical protein
MRIVKLGLAAAAASMLLTACGTTGLANRERPDEMAVARNAPLIIPPDFSLAPPTPGQPQPVGADSRTQALQALFGGPAPRSESERQMLDAAGNGTGTTTGARSTVGDPNTNVVEKGQVTQTILAVPEGDGQEARVSTPR